MKSISPLNALIKVEFNVIHKNRYNVREVYHWVNGYIKDSSNQLNSRFQTNFSILSLFSVDLYYFFYDFVFAVYSCFMGFPMD